jgi:predicted nucleotidyltransferase
MVAPMEQLDRIVSLVRASLGDALLGTYLHGSAVAGGLKPHSDLDVLAVSSRHLDAAEKQALIAALLPVSGRGDPSGRSRPVELTVVVQADVRPWRYPPPLELMYGDWWRPEFAAGNFAPWADPNPDLAILLAQVLAADHPLSGPPAAELLDPVPPEDVARAMRDGIPGLLADLDDDTANVLLTLARIWVTLTTGQIVPKDVAADWALERLPEEHRPVLVRARAVYLGEAEDAWNDLADRVHPHSQELQRELRAAGQNR